MGYRNKANHNELCEDQKSRDGNETANVIVVVVESERIAAPGNNNAMAVS